MNTDHRPIAEDRPPRSRLVEPSAWSAMSVGAVAAAALASFGVGAVCVLGEGLSDAAKLVGAAVLVAVTAWAAREPRVALLSCVLLAVLDRRVGIAGFSAQISEVALAVMAPSFVRHWPGPAEPSRRARTAILLLLAGLIGSTIVAQDLESAILGLVRWALVLNLVVGGIGIVRRFDRDLHALTVTLVGAGVVAGLLAGLQYVGVDSLVGEPFDPERVDSTFGYYSNFANFEAVVAVLAVVLLAAAARHRRLALAVLGLIGLTTRVACLLITISRGALLLVVTALAVLAVVRRRSAVQVGAIVVVSSVGVALVSTLAPTLFADYRDRFVTEQGGDSLRYELQAGASDLLADHPLGIGFGNFRFYVESGAVQAESALAHSHNLFLQMGLDAGWLGAAAFISLCAMLALRGIRGATSDRYGLHAGYVAAFVGFLVQGWNDFFFFETASMVVFGVLVVGTAHAGDTRAAPSEQQGPTPDVLEASR